MRPGTILDKPRVLEISAQIWEGEDYVPAVIDYWLADQAGEFTVAEYNGEVMGFAKFTLLTPQDGWMEGIRVDPKARNLGIGKLLTLYFLDKAKALKLRSLRLSTHVDNRESIHIIEKFGFKPDAGFVYCSRRLGGASPEGPGTPPALGPAAAPVEAPAKVQAEVSNQALRVRLLQDGDLVARYIISSEFYRCAGGYLPIGWKFQEVEEGLLANLPNFADVYYVGDGMADGIDGNPNGRIEGLMIIAKSARVFAELPVFFLEGDGQAQEQLIDYAFELARRKGFRFLEYMAPQGHSSLAVACKKGMREHCEGTSANAPDVFVYEYPYLHR